MNNTATAGSESGDLYVYFTPKSSYVYITANLVDEVLEIFVERCFYFFCKQHGLTILL